MNRMNSTKFLEVEELRRQLERVDLNATQYTAGGVPFSAADGSAWVDVTDSHTIIFGATGSKKTRMLVMPTVEILSRAGESFVVTDPKGEVYDRTAGAVEKKGYHMVALNLRDYEAGEAWNPLMLPYEYYKACDVPKAVELVSSIAEMLVGEGGKDDAFWFSTAKDVAIGLLLLLFESVGRREECNIKSLLTLWQGYLSDKKAFNKRIRTDFDGTIIRDKLQCLDNSSDKTVGSIEAVFASGINKFSTNEKLIAYLSQPSVSFDSMVKQKTAIYLIVPDENKFYHFIVSLFLEQLYEVLIKEAQQAEDNRLACRMNFVIDEFANLPKIENMDCMITASRSRNIRFALIVQSMNQLKEKYDDAAQIICSNCNNWIYLYSKEYDLLTQISKLCGEVIYDNNMRMPLLSEFDLQHLSKEKGEALVLCGRNEPCLVNLMDIDEYPFEKCAREQERKPLVPVAVVGRDGKGVKGNQNAFYCPIPEELLQSKRKIGSFLGKKKWLVATYQGMVVKNYLVDKEKVESGMAVIEKSMADFSVEEAAQLKWYKGTEEMHQVYTEHLKQHPEFVYMTVEEMDKQCREDSLQELENTFLEWGNNCRRVPQEELEPWSSQNAVLGNQVILEITMDDKTEEKILGELPFGYADLHAHYMHNRALREANKELAGTKFETVPWCMTVHYDGYYFEPDACEYCKHIGTGNYVKMAIKEVIKG